MSDLAPKNPGDSASTDGDTRAHLESIIESAMDGIITVDESQHIVMYNAAAERIFGVDVSEAIGSPLERFIPQRHRPSHAAHVKSFGRTGVTRRAMGHLGLLSGLRSDGTEFPIEASISQAMSGGRKFYTVILRDVTERQKLEAQLLQAQKMEGLGRLAGGVAHDFNNLLMAMFNYLALGVRTLEPGHAARAPLAHAKEAADRAATLTRQLLTFARKQAVTRGVVSPRDVVAGLEPMIRRLIGEDLSLRTNLAPNTGWVVADASQLEQVVVNLAVNARDAMPRGGTFAIETANVTLDEAYCATHPHAKPGAHVMIAVTDTGTGMTAEVLSRLFEPFFTTKEPGKGTGLGLSTCHGIVRQSGGHIAVYSEHGKGTSVKVYLPRVGEGAGGTGPAPELKSRPTGGTETVLLAEDSELIRNLAGEVMAGAGYTVLLAGDGREAADVAGRYSREIDLLVADVVLPGLSGIRLAEEMLAARPKLRVLFMSGYTEDMIDHHGVRREVSEFIAKPFEMDELLRRVREILDERGAAR